MRTLIHSLLLLGLGVSFPAVLFAQDPPASEVVQQALKTWIENHVQPNDPDLERAAWKNGRFVYSASQPLRVVWEVSLVTTNSIADGSPEAAATLKQLQDIFDKMADAALRQNAYFAAGDNLAQVKGNEDRVKLLGLAPRTPPPRKDPPRKDPQVQAPSDGLVYDCDCCRRCGLLRRLFGGRCVGCGTVIRVPSCETILESSCESLANSNRGSHLSNDVVRSGGSSRSASVRQDVAVPYRLVPQAIIGGSSASTAPHIVASEPVTAARIARHFAQPATDILLVSTDGAAAGRSQPKSPEVAREYFSRGYHSFWDRNYAQAWNDVTEGLEVCDDDARLWYYKGFAEVNLGREDDACQSFARALQLHAQMSNDAQVRKSLERIQGKLRLELQSALSMARRTAKPAARQKDFIAARTAE